MKMFKKFVAVMMAAVLSMAMLTACGGGSGSGPSSKLAGILGSGKIWMDVTDIETGENNVMATNGKKFYLEFPHRGEQVKAWIQDGMMYAIMGDLAMKGPFEDEDGEFEFDTVPTKEDLSKIQIGKYTVNGVEYYAERIQDGDRQSIYCFDGNKAVYYIEKDTEDERIYKINQLTGSFDEKKLDPPANVEFLDTSLFD